MRADSRGGNPLGLDLLLRVVAEQTARTRCGQCDASLEGAAIAVRERDPAHVVIEIGCQTCGQARLLRIEPEAGSGVARVG